MYRLRYILEFGDGDILESGGTAPGRTDSTWVNSRSQNVGGASPPILNEMSDGWSNLSVQCSEITYYVITYWLQFWCVRLVNVRRYNDWWWNCNVNIISSTGALEITAFSDPSLHPSIHLFQIFLLILLQFCQSRGGIISDLCRSQSLGTSHSVWVQEEEESSRTCVGASP